MFYALVRKSGENHWYALHTEFNTGKILVSDKKELIEMICKGLIDSHPPQENI